MNSHNNVTAIFWFDVFVGPRNSASHACITNKRRFAAA
jgi:hypothetical protein